MIFLLAPGRSELQLVLVRLSLPTEGQPVVKGSHTLTSLLLSFCMFNKNIILRPFMQKSDPKGFTCCRLTLLFVSLCMFMQRLLNNVSLPLLHVDVARPVCRLALSPMLI